MKKLLAHIKSVDWNGSLDKLDKISKPAGLAFAVWAFFFSPLSQKIQDRFEADLILAKQELVQTRRVKEKLEDDGATLAIARDKLASEIAALQTQLGALHAERAAYAQSTLGDVAAKYLVMVRYEFELIAAIAEICALYDKHLDWLELNREFVRVENDLKQMPSQQRWDGQNPVYAKSQALSQVIRDRPQQWNKVPSKPDFTPRNAIYFSGLFVELMNARGAEEYHRVASKWMFAQITGKDAGRSVAKFVEGTKEYDFVAVLQEAEKSSFISKIDGFLAQNSEFRGKQLGVLLPQGASPKQVVAAGKAQLAFAKEVEAKFTSYLASVDIADKSKTIP
jgi:hypothetical protein